MRDCLVIWAFVNTLGRNWFTHAQQDSVWRLISAIAAEETFGIGNNFVRSMMLQRLKYASGSVSTLLVLSFDTYNVPVVSDAN